MKHVIRNSHILPNPFPFYTRRDHLQFLASSSKILQHRFSVVICRHFEVRDEMTVLIHRSMDDKAKLPEFMVGAVAPYKDIM